MLEINKKFLDNLNLQYRHNSGDGYSLVYGDCLDVMTSMTECGLGGFFDLIITDHDYNLTSCAFDIPIDLDKWWSLAWRVLKPGGTIVLNSAMPFTAHLYLTQAQHWKYEWLWEKSNATGHLQAKKRPLKAHETLQVFQKQVGVYIPQMWEGKPYRWASRRTDSEHFDNRENEVIDNKGERYPRTVLKIKQERGLHPCQKPVELGRYMIRTYTNPGDIVLDTCAGSGTYAVAALLEGRRAVGIELLGEYFRTMVARVMTTRSQLPTPLVPST